MLHDRGKIDTLSIIFKPFNYYLEFSVLSPQLAQIVLTQFDFGPTQYLTSLEYKVFTTKRERESRLYSFLLSLRASFLPCIFISLISPLPANEISKSKVADFRFQRCIFNNTHFPYPSRIPFCVSGQEISFEIESPVASLCVEKLCRIVCTR